MNEATLPLLAQAEEFRSRQSKGSFTAGAKAAIERTAGVIARDIPHIMEEQIEAAPDAGAPPALLPPVEAIAGERVIDVELRMQPWRIIIELTTDPAIGEWVSISDRPVQTEGGIQRRCVAVRLSLAHPFTDRFGGTDVARIEPLLRIAAAIGLAETTAREAGVQMAGTFRATSMNC